MTNWYSEDLLDLVEEKAEAEGWIATEQDLSDLFDSDVLPSVIQQYSVNDEPAIAEIQVCLVGGREWEVLVS